jgi:hypothetical protein
MNLSLSPLAKYLRPDLEPGNCGGGDGMDNNKLAPTKLMSAGGDGVKGVDFPNGVY